MLKCSICGWEGERFNMRSPSGVCSVCGSYSRYRAIANYIKKCDFSLNKVLHFSPNKGLHRILTKYAETYITCDLDKRNTVVTNICDIQALPFKANTFDFVICSHVLEHIPDDIKALSEIKRVMQFGARAIILVPYSSGLKNTFEGIPDMSDEDKLKKFGHENHCRLYGADYQDVIMSVGFAKCIELEILQTERQIYHIIEKKLEIYVK